MDRFISEVELRTEILPRTSSGKPFSRQTLWRWQQKGLFPRSRRLGPGLGRVGFLQSEVDEWLRTREATT